MGFGGNETVLVLGAGGFVGNNLFRRLLVADENAYGSLSPRGSWRLEGLPPNRLTTLDLLDGAALPKLLRDLRPTIIFNCATYGAYPHQQEGARIIATNFTLVTQLLEFLHLHLPETIFINAGSSSEYGGNSAGPKESAFAIPDSIYGIAKLSAAGAVDLYGRVKGLRCANLRLYSIYGPFEEESRLVPRLLRTGLRGSLPPFANAEISRDFVFIDDAIEAFLAAARADRNTLRGQSYNIATGTRTSLAEMASWAKSFFSLTDEAKFETYPGHAWDRTDWFGNAELARETLGWIARHSLREGLEKTVAWYRQPRNERVWRLSPKAATGIAVIVACYNDAPALRELRDRVVAVLTPLSIPFRLLFINDGSPDSCEAVIRELSGEDARVSGISHSRNFGSQAAFRSGMEMARNEACILMDGDLQDPPELIPELVREWKNGNQIVYGVRESREEPFFRNLARRMFYRCFRWSAETRMPLNAGDFGLLDPAAVKALLQCEESDLFLRGLRSYVGFSQKGVPYHRPARKHGETTNSWLSNLEWAKKGLFSFGSRILSWYFLISVVLCVSSSLFVLFALWGDRIDQWAILFTLSLCLFQLLGMALLSDHVGRVFKEVKRRPLFIRHHRIENGNISDWET